MAGAEAPAPAGRRSALVSRIVVGAFLAAVAIADVWVGGPAFTLMIAAGVGLVLWEWGTMHGTRVAWRVAGLGVLACVAMLAHVGEPVAAIAMLAGGVLLFVAISMMARHAGKRWLSTGLFYAGLPAVALIWLRQQPDGFALVMWTMGVVWATDIFAYAAGRAVGGPRIWPAVSPAKTWAGLAGGVAAAALFSALFAAWRGWGSAAVVMGLIGAGLAVVAQMGDFFESWLKRRAGIKDSGSLLGSHGGMMDRVDGLVPVACVVALWVAWAGPRAGPAPGGWL